MTEEAGRLRGEPGQVYRHRHFPDLTVRLLQYHPSQGGSGSEMWRVQWSDGKEESLEWFFLPDLDWTLEGEPAPAAAKAPPPKPQKKRKQERFPSILPASEREFLVCAIRRAAAGEPLTAPELKLLRKLHLIQFQRGWGWLLSTRGLEMAEEKGKVWVLRPFVVRI